MFSISFILLQKGGENQDNLPRVIMFTIFWLVLLVGLWKYLWQDLNLDELKVDPLIYSHFAQGLGEGQYLRIETWENLNRILSEALVNYNEVNAVMNLVLFEDAMQHV